MSRVWSRAILLVGVCLYVLAAGRHLAGERLLLQAQPEPLQRSLRIDSQNPAGWLQYGRARMLFAPQAPDEARAAYARAISLDPFNPTLWNELADCYTVAGDTEGAEAALRRGIAAVPIDPDAVWRLANLLLLEGRNSEALPYLRQSAVLRPIYRGVVFQLAWKVLDSPERILRDVVPTGFDARFHYAQFLVGSKRLREAQAVWQELRKLGGSQLTAFAGNYSQALMSTGQAAEALRVWREASQDAGREEEPGDSVVNNGDFEYEPLNLGLDWRLEPGAGYGLALDDSVFHHAARSLRLTFDGTTNVDFHAAYQLVAVEPSTHYRFSAYLKTENLTTTNGVGFCLEPVDAPASEAVATCTERRVGSNPWLLEAASLQTGPHVHSLRIGLRRDLSPKLDNRISGKVWVDQVALSPVH